MVKNFALAAILGFFAATTFAANEADKKQDATAADAGKDAEKKIEDEKKPEEKK